MGHNQAGDRGFNKHINFDQADERRKVRRDLRRCNSGQKEAFLIVASRIRFPNQNPPKLFFVDGPGGSGKPMMENMLLSFTRGKGLIAIAVASSGVASLLLHGAQTAHSQFDIPLDLHQLSTSKMRRQNAKAK